MKKLLLLSLIAVGCKSGEKKDCPLLVDAGVKFAAIKFAESQECNEEKTVRLFAEAESKMFSCNSGISYSKINAGKIACQVVPDLAKALVEFDLLGLECKKAPQSVDEVLKKILGC